MYITCIPGRGILKLHDYKQLFNVKFQPVPAPAPTLCIDDSRPTQVHFELFSPLSVPLIL